MLNPLAVLVVFLGAGLGGTLRHIVNVFTARWFGPDLPIGTLAVNVCGALAIGIVAGYFALRGEATNTTRVFLVTGVLGGFTTFSAFSLEVALFLERGQMASALTYAAGSVVLCVIAVFGGLALGRS